jgi:hypothetical protein
VFTLWYNWDLTQLTFNSLKLGPKTLYFRKTKIFAVFLLSDEEIYQLPWWHTKPLFPAFQKFRETSTIFCFRKFPLLLLSLRIHFLLFFSLALYLRFIKMDQMRLKWERATFNKTYYVQEHSLIWFLEIVLLADQTSCQLFQAYLIELRHTGVYICVYI